MKALFAWIHQYERQLSAAAMVAGFVIDNLFFQRVDLLATHLLFAGYLIATAVSILWLHFLETRASLDTPRSRLQSILPIVIQFALGGAWSGYLIFYSRSATLAASWPFLLVLGSIFLGNEIFKQYHSRLVFTSVLFFFALFSYAIFAVPTYLGAIGTVPFLASGVVAIGGFILFALALRRLGRERYLSTAWPIRFGVVGVYLVINLFYFATILPPLPLAAKGLGVYHAVTHMGDPYTAQAEEEPWYDSFGLTPTVHVVPNETLYAYSSVFAPVKLRATIIHRWQRYEAAKKAWVTQSTISFPISGGRDGGYRGYSAKANLEAGEWRVNVETTDGLLIGRIRFDVAQAGEAAPLKTISLP